MIIRLVGNSVGRNELEGYRVSLSVVTYNNEEYIGRMLDSLYKFIKGVPFHIYVIDNGSNDCTVKIVESYGDKVTLIKNEKNIGFGEAHNKVLSLLDSEFHVVVNPDIIIDSDVVSAIADYMDRNKDIGAITPKVLYQDGSVQLLPKRDPKFRYLLSRRISCGFFKKYKDEYEMAEKNMDEAFDIEFASGCFMFLRTDLFKSVRGFDERFFLYFEDADLSRRIRHFARIEYNPQFCVYHDWQRAGAKKLKYFLIQIVSMFKYLRKWTRRKKRLAEAR